MPHRAGDPRVLWTKVIGGFVLVATTVVLWRVMERLRETTGKLRVAVLF